MVEDKSNIQEGETSKPNVETHFISVDHDTFQKISKSGAGRLIISDATTNFCIVTYY